MILISLAVAAIAVILAVLAFFTIPAIIEAKNTAVAARELLAGAHSELQPALQDLRIAMADLRKVTSEMGERSNEVRACMEAVGETGRHLRNINNVVGNVAGAFSASSLWLTGAKVAVRFLLDRAARKGRA